MLLMSEHYFYSGISIVASKQTEKIEIDTELLENYLNKSLVLWLVQEGLC